MKRIFYLDGQPVPFTSGQNVLEAAIAAGMARQIPYFCYHPALGSLGACRQCAVKIYPHDDKHPPRVTMACLLPASDHLQLATVDQEVHTEHRKIIELLMLNHPLDCPVCDEGGQCHLQDMTVQTGHAVRRYSGPKRTYRDQDLGPLVHQEMNRCITCYRCVRFYQDTAQGDDFGVFGSRDRVYFGRLEDGPLESPFSGNLVEVCPTGVFTDKVFRHDYARVWDLQQGPSVCPHCAVGCNTLPGARLGTLRRVRARHHPEINPHFLCDRGRYGFRYVTAAERPVRARLHGAHSRQDAVLRQVATRLQEGRSGFLGSPREDVQSNLALFALADCLHAPFAALSSPWMEALAQQCMALPQAPTLNDVEMADHLIVLGDLGGVAPMAELAARQALRHGARLTVLASRPTALAEAGDYRPTRPSALPDLVTGLAEDACLQGSRRPVILAAAETLGPAGVHALRKTLARLPANARAGVFQNSPNLFGAAYFAADGHTARLQHALRQREIDHLLCLAADPLGSDWGAGTWRSLAPGLQGVTVLDMVDTDTVRAAETVLPMAAFPERDGLFINYEGRIQAFAPVYRREAQVPSWQENTRGFPAAAGGQMHPLGPPTPQYWLGRLAELLDIVKPWQERLTFYQRFLCPIAPRPDHPGILLDDALRARFEIAAAPAAAPVGTEDWELDLFRWHGGEALADAAAELQSLAPSRGLRLNADVDASFATLSGPCGRLRLPVLPIVGMVAGVAALDQEGFAQLGLHPGEAVQIQWETVS